MSDVNAQSITGEHNVVIQSIRSSGIQLNLQGAFRGNVILQTVTGSRINVTQCLSRSEEYRELDQSVQRLESELESLADEDPEARYRKSEELNRVRETRDRFREDVGRLADTFAGIAVDSERLGRARELFLAGRFREADALLKEDDLSADQNLLSAEHSRIAEGAEANEERLQANAAEFLIKAHLTALDHERPDRFEATRGFYLRSLAAAETFENCSAYADFLLAHQVYEDARLYFEKSLDHARNESERADALDRLARTCTENNQLERAGVVFAEVLPLREAGAAADPQFGPPALARSLAGRAVWHDRTNRYDAAESDYQSALSILKPLAESGESPYLPEVAQLLHGLADLYHRACEMELADRVLSQALEARQSLAERSPHTFEPALVATLGLSGRQAAARGDFAAANETFLKARKLLENNARRDPLVHEPALAELLCDHARVLDRQGAADETRTAYERAREILVALCERDPRAFHPALARTLNRFAHFLMMQGDPTHPALFEHAFRLQERLVARDPHAFEPDLADTLENLAHLYRNVEQAGAEEQAFAYQKRAVEILERFAAENPNVYEPRLARALVALANQRPPEPTEPGARSPEAEQEFEALLNRALAIQTKLAERNPGAFELDLSRTYQGLALLHLTRGDLNQSEELQKRILTIRESLAEKNPAAFEKDLATTLLNTSVFFAQYRQNRLKAGNLARRGFEIALRRRAYDSMMQTLVERYRELLSALGEDPRALETPESDNRPQAISRVGSNDPGPASPPGLKPLTSFRASTTPPPVVQSDDALQVADVADEAIDIHQFVSGVEDISIEQVQGANINIVQYLSRSVEYRRLALRITELEGKLEEAPDGSGERANLAAQLDRLRETERGFRADVEQLARTFSEVAIDSERWSRARELFEAGQFREADRVLQAGEMLREQEALLAERKRFFRRKKENEKKLRGNAGEFLIKAQLQALDYTDPGRFEKARRLFLRSFDSAELFANRKGYAEFLMNNGEDRKAVPQIQRALELTESSSARAELLNRLGIAYNRQGDFAGAERVYLETLAIEAPRAERDPETRGDYATTLTNLGILYKQNFEFEKARTRYTEALDIYEELYRQDPDHHEHSLARVCALVANLYNKQGDPALARPYYERALAIQEKLTEQDPEEREPELAVTLINFADNLSRLEEFDRADTVFARATGLGQKLAHKNPRAYEPQYASMQEFQAMHLLKKGDPAASGTLHQRVLKQRETLAARDFAAFGPGVLMSLGHLVALRLFTKEFDAARRHFERMLELCARFGREHPQLYRDGLAMDLESLVHWCHDHTELNEDVQLPRLIELYAELAQNHSGVIFERGRATALEHHGDILAEREAKTEAAAVYRQARTLFAELALEDPDQFGSAISRMDYKLKALAGDVAPGGSAETDYEDPAYPIEGAAQALLEKQMYAEAEEQLLRAVALREEISDEYLDNVARRGVDYYRLGLICFYTGRMDESARNYEMARALLEQVRPHDLSSVMGVLPHVYKNMGLLQDHADAPERAREMFDAAIALYRQAGADDPEHVAEIACCHFETGMAFLRQDRRDEARRCYEQALPLYERLSPEQRAEHLVNYSGTLVYLAHCLSFEAAGKEDTLQLLRKALPLLLLLKESVPDAINDLKNLRRTLIRLEVDPEEFVAKNSRK